MKHWIGLNYDTHYSLLQKRTRSDGACVYIHVFMHAHRITRIHTRHIYIHSVTQHSCICEFAYWRDIGMNELSCFFFTWIKKINFFTRKKKVYKGFFDVRINYGNEMILFKLMITKKNNFRWLIIESFWNLFKKCYIDCYYCVMHIALITRNATIKINKTVGMWKKTRIYYPN